jgi:mycothiol synthase
VGNSLPFAGDGDKAITHWFVFVREANGEQRECLEDNGFRLFRTSHLLVRPALPVSPVVLPAGVGIRNFRFGEDESVYCSIRNEAFRSLQGSQTPLLPGDVAAMASDGQTLADGIFLLTFEGEPAGVVRTSCDFEGDEGEPMLEIGPLAILPRHQGRGFGTLLLRHALAFGVSKGISRAVLSVNAENTPALGLYLREGFVVDQGFLCLKEDFV